MRLRLLHLDDSLQRMPDFCALMVAEEAAEWPYEAEGAAVRLWAASGAWNAFRERLEVILDGDPDEKNENTPVTFFGSGDFHHVTSLLLNDALKKRSSRVTVFHFDNHPDWVTFKEGIHCGSWVNDVLLHPLVDRVVTIGPATSDLAFPEWKGANLAAVCKGSHEVFAYNHPPSLVWGNYHRTACFVQRGHRLIWRTVERYVKNSLSNSTGANTQRETTSSRLRKLLEERLAAISTDDVYLTIDKDVLCPDDAVTNWEPGKMPLDELIASLRIIRTHKNIIGIDVSGEFSPSRFSGPSVECFWKRFESWVDQPWFTPSAEIACSRNTRTNIALLDCFREILT
ncbi:MAG: arginase family protein [Candidatus Riflebacteria bacterium]|nr:arginase family protein [Candidatus Riflebacteria bacterium]